MLELIISVIGTVSVIVVTIITARSNERIKKIELDAAATREQTQNEHATAEYPNLRDELTATRESVEALARSQDRTNKLTEDYIRDVDKSVRATQKSLERHTTLAESRLDEIPQLIEIAIKTHSTTCPLVTSEKEGGKG